MLNYLVNFDKVPKEFRDGLSKLAQKLQVQVHERESVTLEACKLVIAQLVTSSRLVISQTQIYSAGRLEITVTVRKI